MKKQTITLTGHEAVLLTIAIEERIKYLSSLSQGFSKTRIEKLQRILTVITGGEVTISSVNI